MLARDLLGTLQSASNVTREPGSRGRAAEARKGVAKLSPRWGVGRRSVKGVNGCVDVYTLYMYVYIYICTYVFRIYVYILIFIYTYMLVRPPDPQLLCLGASVAKLSRNFQISKFPALSSRFFKFSDSQPQGSRIPNFPMSSPKALDFRISSAKALDFQMPMNVYIYMYMGTRCVHVFVFCLHVFAVKNPQ